MFNDTHLPASETHGVQAEFPVDSSAEAPRDASALAPRFSRLALCVTAAGALTLGVVGTVAYGVWFEHDQQAYAEAMSNARQSLGMASTVDSVPVRQVVSARAETPLFANTSASGAARASQDAREQGQLAEDASQHAVWTGQVVQAPAAAAPAVLGGEGSVGSEARLATPAASTVSTSTAPASRSTRRATGSSDSSAPQPAASRTAKATRAGQQERRATAADAQQAAQAARQNARRQSTLFARMSLFFRRVGYRQHGGANPQQQDIYAHP